MELAFSRKEVQSALALPELTDRSLRVSGESRLPRMEKMRASSSSTHSSVNSGSADSPSYITDQPITLP